MFLFIFFFPLKYSGFFCEILIFTDFIVHLWDEVQAILFVIWDDFQYT